MSIHNRDHDGLQRLANLNIHLAAQSQHHRRHILCHLHTLFQVLVDQSLVANWEFGQVNRCDLLTSGSRDQVTEQLVCIERRDRSHQLGDRFQTGVQRLIGGQLIGRHASTPETAAVQTHIPVTQIVVYEI